MALPSPPARADLRPRLLQALARGVARRARGVQDAERGVVRVLQARAPVREHAEQGRIAEHVVEPQGGERRREPRQRPVVLEAGLDAEHGRRRPVVARLDEGLRGENRLLVAGDCGVEERQELVQLLLGQRELDEARRERLLHRGERVLGRDDGFERELRDGHIGRAFARAVRVAQADDEPVLDYDLASPRCAAARAVEHAQRHLVRALGVDLEGDAVAVRAGAERRAVERPLVARDRPGRVAGVEVDVPGRRLHRPGEVCGGRSRGGVLIRQLRQLEPRRHGVIEARGQRCGVARARASPADYGDQETHPDGQPSSCEWLHEPRHTPISGSGEWAIRPVASGPPRRAVRRRQSVSGREEIGSATFGIAAREPSTRRICMIAQAAPESSSLRRSAAAPSKPDHARAGSGAGHS